MKTKILLGIISIGLLSSCSSVYKSGQTPDDVYYSPAKAIADKEERQQDYTTKQDDNYLRMKVRNCNRWSRIDDYSYWYDSRYQFDNCSNYYKTGWSDYSFSGWNSYSYSSWGSYSNCNCNCNSSWGNHWNSWGNWHSPFYVIAYKNPTYYRGSTTGSNVSAYRNKKYSNTNSTYTGKAGTTYTNGSSNNGGTTRTYTNGTSGSSSAGGKSGGYNSTGTTGGTRGGRN
jgi:hypothetical protein